MNAAEIARRLADRAADVAAYLLPEGKKAGKEWKVGSISGEPGRSLSVCTSGPKAGQWKDFQAEISGDLLDLWAATRGLSAAQAISEAKQYLGIRDTMPERPPRTYAVPTKPKTALPSVTGQWLESRGLTVATIEAFKVREVTRGGEPWALFPYLRDGVYVNGKYRNPEDKKGMQQEKDAEPCLFGWHLIDPKARRVVIAEGEIDAMTLHQVGLPALSVNAGAGNHQWIENDWQRLERFSEILVCFDSDEAGDKGAREVITRLGLERCKRMRVGAKDANQWLQDGATPEQFHEAARTAKSQDPEELRQAADFIDRVKLMFYPEPGMSGDPVLRLDKDYEWFEFRGGEVTVWTGYNGHGKTTIQSQMLLGLLQQGKKFCQFSGEMSPDRQVKRMCKQATGLDKPSKAYLDAVGDWLRDRAWIFDVHGSATIARLLEVFEYAIKRYGIHHFVIDSLMMTDVPEDGPGSLTAQKQAMQKICDFAKRFGVHVHLIAHPRKGRDESQGPGKMDVAGSSKITDGADNVFTVWAALRDEADPPTDEYDAKLELRKQRNGDVQHRTVYLWFVKSSQQYASTPRRRSIRYFDWSALDNGAPAEEMAGGTH